MTKFAIFGVVRSAAIYLAVGLCTSQAAVAEDFATLFDEEFKGISLTLIDSDRALARRSREAELSVDSLPGFPLTAEELSLVWRLTDPVGLAADQDPGDTSLGDRLLGWMTRHSNESDGTSVFSALVRAPDEPGMRIDIDTYTDEITLEYRVGF